MLKDQCRNGVFIDWLIYERSLTCNQINKNMKSLSQQGTASARLVQSSRVQAAEEGKKISRVAETVHGYANNESLFDLALLQ